MEPILAEGQPMNRDDLLKVIGLDYHRGIPCTK